MINKYTEDDRIAVVPYYSNISYDPIREFVFLLYLIVND